MRRHQDVAPVADERAETMRRGSARYAAAGQACFGAMIAVCVALHPGIVLKANEGGMSNYGTHLKTALPYTLALGLLAYFSRRAAAPLEGSSGHARRLRVLLRAYVWFVLAMLVSSYVYSLNMTLRDVHFAIGAVLIVVELVASLWMFSLSGRAPWDGALVALLLGGDLLACLTAAGALHLLFVAEVMMYVGFGSLLVRASARVDERLAGARA